MDYNAVRMLFEGEMMDYNAVRMLFDYDPLTGDLLWKQSAGGRVLGFKAGGPRNGTKQYITIKGTPYRTDTLVWLYFYNELPFNNLDHIDNNDENTRIDNLREVLGRLDRFRLKGTGIDWGEKEFIEKLCDRLTTSRGIRPIYRE